MPESHCALDPQHFALPGVAISNARAAAVERVAAGREAQLVERPGILTFYLTTDADNPFSMLFGGKGGEQRKTGSDKKGFLDEVATAPEDRKSNVRVSDPQRLTGSGLCAVSGFRTA